jgi:hypothetical protein
MIMQDVEALRYQITLYKTVCHSGIIALYDYYESRDYMYLCFDKNNDISDKEMFGLHDLSINEDTPSKLLRCLVNIAQQESLNLHDYAVYFQNKPKCELIEVEGRYK